ncbi:TetR/AcrR family transcriptional regulator [Streptomyces carpinensis]|uniref:TetR/AcrR family transcriptional regulator n=1 Tax=Streptomyces carpinensis TaxID=66369 RepID=A0ABV1VZM0_9ACTN|nr:TetR/AcrR family transcriptional regulator [Streptomyces carpinensis]
MTVNRADLRFQRSRVSLYRAVLDLAESRAPTEMTASEIAAAAGVNRSTFYQHASSPAKLLRDALAAELDEVRHCHLDGVTGDRLREAPLEVAIAVLGHIQDHAAIYYEAAVASDDAAGLWIMLADHFEESAHLVDPVRIHKDTPEPWEQAIVFRSVAGAAVGAIQAWLRAEMPRPPERFAELLVRLLQQGWLG